MLSEDLPLYKLHLLAALASGRGRSCGRKVRYSEQSAIAAAEAMTIKSGRDLEPYPCPFCWDWHIGGAMDKDVLRKIVSDYLSDVTLVAS